MQRIKHEYLANDTNICNVVTKRLKTYKLLGGLSEAFINGMAWLPSHSHEQAVVKFHGSGEGKLTQIFHLNVCLKERTSRFFRRKGTAAPSNKFQNAARERIDANSLPAMVILSRNIRGKAQREFYRRAFP